MQFLTLKNKKHVIIKMTIAIAIFIHAMLKIFKHGCDFDVFLDAGHKLINAQNIYGPPLTRGLQYYYSPFFALLLSPLSYFPYVAIEFIWLVLITFFLLRTWQITAQYLKFNLLIKNELNVLIFAVAFLTAPIVLANYYVVQVNTLILWVTMESLLLFQMKKHFKGGLLLAFGCTTKILPIVFIPYLLYRMESKAVIFTILSCVAFLFVPAIFIGISFNNFLLREWWLIINPFKHEFLIEIDPGVHSLGAVVPVFLIKTPGEIPLDRNFFNLTIEQTLLITNIIRAIFAVATLYFLNSWPFRRAVSDAQVIWECSYLLLISPLIFPHQQKYAFIYILPAVTYLAYYIIIAFKVQSGDRYALSIFCIMIFLVFNPIVSPDIIGRYAYNVLQHFKVLTFVTLSLCMFLGFCTAKKLEDRYVQLYNV